jgi:dGTPase
MFGEETNQTGEKFFQIKHKFLYRLQVNPKKETDFYRDRIEKVEKMSEEYSQENRLSHLSVSHLETGGREYHENEHPYRSPFQRDRDRIYHSSAFKRLQSKTQVFAANRGENFRTRLTHTLEVMAISRSMARVLGLNEDLSEVIALAHDLGHSPFGHAGQDELAELMKDQGGFEHNKQSLRIVRFLEVRYPDFPGLNLCMKTLQGIMKHGSSYDKDIENLRNANGPSLESLIVDRADEIAYSCHDLEDGWEQNMLSYESLRNIDLWRRVEDSLPSKENIWKGNLNTKVKFRTIQRNLINFLVTDLIKNLQENIKIRKIHSKADLKTDWDNGGRIVKFSDSISNEFYEMKKYLKKNLYDHKLVVQRSNEGREMISKLFHHIKKNPQKLPESYSSRMEKDGLERVICDFIAGMTDTYAEEFLEIALIDSKTSDWTL